MGHSGQSAEILSATSIYDELPEDAAFAELDDHPHDECGVFGIWAPGQGVLQKTIQGMEGLQHRGHSGAGIAYVLSNVEPANGASKPVVIHKGVGHVREAIPEIYRPEDKNWEFNLAVFDKLVGSPVAIGHTRYSTAESEDREALHQHRLSRTGGALGHNGEVINMPDVAWDFAVDLSDAASDSGALAEVLDVQAARRGDLVAAMHDVLPRVDGAYCLTIIDKERLLAARDPWGWHPLALGELSDGKGFVVASEQIVFQEVGAQFVRDIEPGEIVVIDEHGIQSSFINRREQRQLCGFEGIYTAREDGEIEGIGIRKWRKNLGRLHAKDHPMKEGAIVVAVPATGTPFGEGYAEGCGVVPVQAIEKRAGAPRTFQMRGGKRADAIDRKYIFHEELIRGRDIELCDDSTIKGHTHRAIIKKLIREYGARSVRLRLSGWRYQNPCYMGMDTHERRNLIAAHKTDAEIAEEVGAEEVTYNTPARVQEAADLAHVTRKAGKLCVSCFTGNYPFRVPEGTTHLGMPRTREDSDLGALVLQIA